MDEPQVPDPESIRRLDVTRITREARARSEDGIAVEEPLEIRVVHGSQRLGKSLAITMRTPGHDFELAAGFLFAERIVTQREQIAKMAFCGEPAPGRAHSNIVRLTLRDDVDLDHRRLERNFFSNSACGLCGKASLEALAIDASPIVDDESQRIDAELVHGLPDLLHGDQSLFHATGGVHGAAFVSMRGEVRVVREDVGRHNAVDKAVGREFLAGTFDAERAADALAHHVLVVSGRTSYEILQKALTARVSMVVGVGPPSSLAIELAERFGLTLVGFTRGGRFNVYAGSQRVRG
ncbi:MAG: formate dehydrogenase accessory sulfurtransferase FdhD [Planctomycetes bacterium]|nr:formate dehydrogenase accessory sulfurtransferase FdhD [Planctomycetota bacterium]